MVDIWRVNELSHNLLLGVTVRVVGHQLVHAVVDVRGVDELQAAVVLALGGDVDHCVDEVVLLEELVVVVPLELGLGVASHGEGDAPVVVEHGLQELQDGWRDWGEEAGGSVGGGTGGRGRETGSRQGRDNRKVNTRRVKSKHSQARERSGRLVGKGDATQGGEMWRQVRGGSAVCRRELHRRRSYTERKHGESIRFAKRQ